MEEELKIEVRQYIKRSEDAIDTVKILIDHKKYSDAFPKPTAPCFMRRVRC